MPAHKRKHGWNPDPESAAQQYQPAHMFASRLYAAEDFKPLDAADHRPFRGSAIYQGGIGSCFCFGVTRQFQLWNKLHGFDDALVSPRALYDAARAQEFAGLDPEEIEDRLTDSGCYPYLGFQAIEHVGFVPWSVCPYPTGDDAWDPTWIEQVVHHRLPPAMWAEAFEQRGIVSARVNASGLAKVETVAELLQLGAPVGFGMPVDLAFEQNAGGLIDKINPRLVQGGHYIAVLAVTDEHGNGIDADHVDENSQVVFDNWWEGWGNAQGEGRMSAELFGSDDISDVTAVRFVPAAAPEVQS